MIDRSTLRVWWKCMILGDHEYQKKDGLGEREGKTVVCLRCKEEWWVPPPSLLGAGYW